MKMFLMRFIAVIIDGLVLGVVYKMIGSAGLLVAFAYEVCLLVLWNGQTIGKKVMGLKVTPQPGWGTAVLRTLVKYALSPILLLGFLWMLWDKKGQTWHDKIANTKVK